MTYVLRDWTKGLYSCVRFRHSYTITVHMYINLVYILCFSPNHIFRKFKFLFHENCQYTGVWIYCGVSKYCSVCLKIGYTLRFSLNICYYLCIQHLQYINSYIQYNFIGKGFGHKFCST